MLFLLLIKEKTEGICFTHFLSPGIGEVSSTSLPFNFPINPLPKSFKVVHGYSLVSSVILEICSTVVCLKVFVFLCVCCGHIFLGLNFFKLV